MVKYDMSHKKQKKYKEIKTKYEKKLNIILFIIILVSLVFPFYWMTIGRDTFRCFVFELLKKTGNLPQIVENLHTNMDFIGTAVWTLTTILSAFVTLYYGALGYRNYGIANRKIISYVYGSIFIPFLVVLNAFIVGLMTYNYYVSYYMDFYILACYSCFLQAYLIALCVYSTTRYKAFKTIMKIEEKEFCDLYNKTQSLETASYELENVSKYQKRKEELDVEKDCFVYHLNSILRWDEPLSEKQEIMRNILILPFNQALPNNNSFFKVMYGYLYHNFRIIVSYMKEKVGEATDLNDIQEIQGIYTVIYKSLTNIQENKGLEDGDKKRVSIYFCAFFNAFVSEKMLSDRWDAISYILKSIVKNDNIKETIIVELLMSVQYQVEIGSIAINDVEEINNIVRNIQHLPGFEKIKPNIKLLVAENKVFFQSLVFSWLEGTTESRISRYSIWEEIHKGLEGRGRHDILDYLLQC